MQKSKNFFKAERTSIKKRSSQSRKKRISLGCGRSIQEINKLLKQFKKMSQMVKKVGKNKQFESMLKSGDQNNIQSMLTNNKFL